MLRQQHLLADRLREAVGEWKPGFTVSVGFSAPVDAPGGVGTAHREVRAVLDTLARFKRWAQVVAVPELGLTGLLAGLSDDRLVEFVNRHLGSLVDHDRARGFVVSRGGITVVGKGQEVTP